MDTSAIHEDDPDLRALRLDGDRAAPLARVHFAEGMLLGIEATNAEQEFHRRRLVRHQHCLHGAGTVVGLAVSVGTDDVATKPSRVRVRVGPGVAIDGLGREVHCAESYCMDLVDWLVAQGDDTRAGAFGADGLFRLPKWLTPHAAKLREAVHDGALVLRVTVRQEACARGLQPVFAHRLNDSTDAVDASRISDGVKLELVPDDRLDEDFEGRPHVWADWGVPPDDELKLTAAETTRLEALPPTKRALMRRRARLVHAASSGLPAGGGAGTLPETFAAAARILLARISIPVAGDDISVDPKAISVDNLVRPFAVSDHLLPTA